MGSHLKGEIRTPENPTVGGGIVRDRYLTPTIIFAFGIISIAMFAWETHINNRASTYFALADAVMDVQVYAATSYTRVAGLGEDRPVDKAWSDLDHAITLSELILRGGPSEYGLILQPLQDPHLRSQIEDLLGMLSEFKMIAQQRYQNSERAQPLPLLDKRLAEVFNTLLDNANAAEMTIEKNYLNNQAKARRLSAGILLAFSCVLVAATAGLWSRERRRRAAELAHLKVNADLETQAEELHRHQEHLLELVEERTMSLGTTNLELQREVAERKEAEEALRKSEEQYRMLIETMNEGVMIRDGGGVLRYVNDRFCQMLGYSREELLGRRDTDFLLEAEWESIPQHSHDRSEVKLKRKDGEKVFAIVSPRSIYDKDRNVVGDFAVITDITEKVVLQADRIRTAHLVSLGEVASGVAHEINNPINGIINYAQILSEAEREGQTHDISNRILKEARRIADIVRDLLLFARGGKGGKEPVHMRALLSDSLRLVGSEMMREGIQIRTTIPDDLPGIVGDPREIQQVFMNIISNARYALNQKYHERHEEKRLQIHAEQVTISGFPYVRITFHDSGVGIPAGIIERVREPFFSTKPRGKGTGLGLSISDGIVRDHGGALTIESVEGEFTTVAIDLPGGGSNGDDSCH